MTMKNEINVELRGVTAYGTAEVELSDCSVSATLTDISTYSQLKGDVEESEEAIL